MNNTISRKINIQNKPDLTPTSLHWSPSSPVVGSPLALSVEVENIGNITTPNDWIGVLYTINGICPEAMHCQWGGVKTSLEPGEKIIIGTNESLWNSTLGTHQIGALIDDQNLIKESNEDNNIITRPITVKPK
ncbi:CARDB domain-containing protein [Pseudomonas delhiensis]|uniref:CARDB domain-containing protein n=1 Tax=Pseudomonas delhiensis TaxID=366289 RepID=UPI000B784586